MPDVLWGTGRVIGYALLVTMACACSGTTATTSPGTHTTVPAPARSEPRANDAASPSEAGSGEPVRSRPVEKLLVFVEENHSLDQMRDGMPYTYRLATRYGYATDYHALTHPSLPNYLAIAGGQMFGVTDDDGPDSHPIDDPSVFGLALAKDRSAAVYADGMPTPCDTEDGGDDYAVRHNPWTYFVDERAECRRFDVPVAQLGADARTGRLPNVGFVAPNLCHDAHDCDLSEADAWFAARMKEVLAGPDWRSGRLAVVLTADEDDESADNTVLTVVIHPSQHGNVVDEPLDHYSLSRLYAQVAHADPPYRAADATSLAEAFDLPVG